ncbi:DUF5677 domain-containing protein [Fictibacillus sp. WQ 8-8]|uniref:DUF5677 domain-containing protein n=1 Tax=Fictibacillus sp. WQ 8-8 TaxID=2938788 RepID=UPI00210EAF88|nr:DUF5677 domain-containing protein [Fictibacillus sp. WQ 8-8]MCQ6265611.1 DUF5677 domain-containing protein [Fictibacillus sp. WQ 8-8]
MNKEEKIEYAHFLIEDITKWFLQKDEPYIILPDMEYLREVITLYAKQSNLFESTLLLLENNHAEEAFILLRSMLNNSMLIDYLCHDNDEKKRYREYMIQPLKSETAFLKNISQGIKKGWIKSDYPTLESRIKNNEKILIKEGFIQTRGKKVRADTRLITIKSMADSDELLFAHYLAFYREASKYEHSDFASLEIYRQTVVEEYPNTVAFILDLSRTDPELELKVLNLSITIYSLTFMRLLQHINNKHEHLIPEENKQSLTNIAVLISKSKGEFPLAEVNG